MRGARRVGRDPQWGTAVIRWSHLDADQENPWRGAGLDH
jgi:hypothetical protein